MSGAAPVVTVIRPELTPEERERRMQTVRKALAEFFLACAADSARREKERKT